jgi:hypothetical protein
VSQLQEALRPPRDGEGETRAQVRELRVDSFLPIWGRIPDRVSLI